MRQHRQRKKEKVHDGIMIIEFAEGKKNLKSSERYILGMQLTVIRQTGRIVPRHHALCL
jgi:hypothetical protein